MQKKKKKKKKLIADSKKSAVLSGLLKLQKKEVRKIIYIKPMIILLNLQRDVIECNAVDCFKRVAC